MQDSYKLISRYLVCAAFVLLWMAIEHYFRVKPLVMQLLGIPMVVVFQVAIARRPLVQLWARDAKAFQLDRWTFAIAGAIAIAAGVLLLVNRHQHAPGLGDRLGLFALVVAASVPAAIGIRAQRAEAFGRAVPLVVLAVAWRVVVQAYWHWADRGLLIPAARLIDFSALWVCEFAALFLVDEVVFRGALDPYLEQVGSGRIHAWCSAIFLSFLWAIWHLPAYNPGAKSFGGLFAAFNLFSVTIFVLGIILSFCARRARTLVPSSLVHAFGNAYVLSLIR